MRQRHGVDRRRHGGPRLRTAVLVAMFSAGIPAWAEQTSAPVDNEPQKAEPAAPEEPKKAKFGPGASFIPFAGYSTDFGLEGGALASLFWFANGIEPYALRVDVLLFGSQRLQTYLFGTFDAPNVLGLPLRLGGRIGLANALSENYCGMAMNADCSRPRAEAAADRFLDEHQLSGHSKHLDAAHEELANKYYWYRLTAPTFGIYGRYNITRALQLFARYDYTYFIPNPYPVSRLKEEMPFGARRGGSSSTPQLGFIVDTRDFEPAPTRGTFSEVSVRVSSKVYGAGYDWVGVNATFRHYLGLTSSGRFVLATRLIADLMFGDVPFYEQGYFGGTDSLNGIGGERGGRGIRFQRYRGKGRFLWTEEFRATWTSFRVPLGPLGTVDLDPGSVFFIDVGKVISEWPELSFIKGRPTITDRDGRPPTELVHGIGVGLRMTINKLVILKGDFAWSPQERTPGIYLNVNHVF